MADIQTGFVKDVFDAIGIKEIIWIDDCFAPKNSDQLRTLIQSFAETLYDNDMELGHESFNSLSLTMPRDLFVVKVGELLSSTDASLQELSDTLEEQIHNYNPSLLGNDDLSRKQIETILASLGHSVHKYSLSDWERAQEDGVNFDEKFLFLIDREFTKEGRSEVVGENLIQQLLQSENFASYCILFTHTASETDEESTRLDIYQDFERQGIDRRHQFSVMAKSKIVASDTNIDKKLGASLKRVYIQRLSYLLVSSAKAIMIDSLERGVEDLLRLSVYDIDNAIFVNSLSEGASELDVVQRLLFLTQKIETQTKFAQDASIIKELTKLRKLQSADIELNGTSSTPSKLKEWRKREIFEPSNVINNIHSPLVCGDVFHKKGSSKYFVLLAQPCDMMVRKDGKRQAETGIFAECKKLSLSSFNSNRSGRYYSIADFGLFNIDPDKEIYVIDFIDSAFVSLNVLDLAVFNKAGNVEMKEKDKLPDLLHLPGWCQRQPKFDTPFA